MTTHVYLSGHNPIHDYVLRAFYEGCQDDKKLLFLGDYQPSDVAVVFGIRKNVVPLSWPRGEVIRQQKMNGRKVVVLETGYVKRGDGKEDYYAAGFDSINGRADFKNKGSPPGRADLQSIRLRDWRSDGDIILVCGQVPWDASVQHSDHLEWIRRTIAELQRRQGRPVIFRPHPLARKFEYGSTFAAPGSAFRSDVPLSEDLARAYAVVTFNSNAGVDACIAGIPTFVDDPGSMAWAVANHDIDQIEDPITPDRTQWFNNLAYAQWRPDEMADGMTWKHLFRA